MRQLIRLSELAGAHISAVISPATAIGSPTDISFKASIVFLSKAIACHQREEPLRFSRIVAGTKGFPFFDVRTSAGLLTTPPTIARVLICPPPRLRRRVVAERGRRC